MSLKFCPKCGDKLDPDTAFCPACGADLKKRMSSKTTIESEESITMPKSEIQPRTVQYADFVIRLIALIIDSIAIGIIGSLLSLVLFAFWVPFNIWDPLSGWWAVGFPFDWLIGFLYHWILEAYNNGQTLGKMALKIRTVDEKTLKTANPGNYAINNIFKSSPFLILDLIIGVLKNSGDPKNRLRIMQNVSETVVISLR